MPIRIALDAFSCRSGCGACCIAPSITSPIPGMPQGKPAGIRCVQLDDANLCRIFGHPDRPAFCSSLKAEVEMCGNSRAEAIGLLNQLEELTKPLSTR